MDYENRLILQAKTEHRTNIPELLLNGDSLKQLGTRSSYVLYKSRKKWIESQNERAPILFGLDPDIITSQS